MVPDSVHFYSADQSPADFIDLFERFDGPTMNAYEAAQKSGKEQDLHRQLVEMANAANQSRNGGTAISATYLRVTVQV